MRIGHNIRCSGEIVTFQNKDAAFEKGVHCASGSSKMKNVKNQYHEGCAVRMSSTEMLSCGFGCLPVHASFLSVQRYHSCNE